MTTASFSLFLASLALACVSGTVAARALTLVHRRAPDSAIGLLFTDLRSAALWLAALIAIVTTLGSLCYSEVAHFVPCKLCWYQRIASYCARCRGARGERGFWPRLVGRVAQRYPHIEDQKNVVRNGRGAMPSWAGTLSPAEIDAVVRYEREVLR